MRVNPGMGSIEVHSRTGEPVVQFEAVGVACEA